jgi:hypothetical protein
MCSETKSIFTTADPPPPGSFAAALSNLRALAAVADEITCRVDAAVASVTADEPARAALLAIEAVAAQIEDTDARETARASLAAAWLAEQFLPHLPPAFRVRAHLVSREVALATWIAAHHLRFRDGQIEFDAPLVVEEGPP